MSSYIEFSRLYYAYFKQIPSIKAMAFSDGSKLRNWLEKEWKDQIVQQNVNEYYTSKQKGMGFRDVFYLLNNELVIYLEPDTARVLYKPSQDAIAQETILQFRRLLVPEKKKQRISLVVSTERGLNTVALKFQQPKLSLSTNYNDDLLPVHDKIVQQLKKKDKSGLILFHGQAGTGKSTYIKHLIQNINKKVIFMPPSLAGHLDAPSVVHLLLANANTVFVIEDGEELLSSRDTGMNAGISMLLNITDGILGESLGIQVIATFNTALRNIDKALLRKGRLTALYEFKPLSIEKSKASLLQAGIHHYQVQQPMTLADIYHAKEEPFALRRNEAPKIGFLSNAV